MGDDDPWGTSDDPEEAARAAKEMAELEAEQEKIKAEIEAATAASGGGGGGGGDDLSSSGPRLPREIPPEEDPRRLKLRHHWVRPKFLNYKYIYDYRQNYYDDVIDYLDRRQKGLIREIPRAQEWAERAMRTSVNKFGRTEQDNAAMKDLYLLSDISTSAKFYRYHSNAFVHQKYGKYLYR